MNTSVDYDADYLLSDLSALQIWVRKRLLDVATGKDSAAVRAMVELLNLPAIQRDDIEASDILLKEAIDYVRSQGYIVTEAPATGAE